MPTVFILNEAGHQFDAARKYGDLVVVTRGNVNVFNTDRLSYDIGEILATAQEGDFIVLSGTPTIAALAMTYLCKETTIETINILIWSASRRDYVPRFVELRRKLSA